MFLFPIHVINFRIQGLTCSPISHCVIIHHYIYLKPVPSNLSFPYRIIHKLLIIHFFIDNLFLPNFIQACQTDRTVCTKNNLLYFVIESLMGFLSTSFVFTQFQRGMFNSFAFSNNVVLSIYYYFVTLRQVTKVFCSSFLHLKKSIIIHHHPTCYIVGFLHRCVYNLQHIPVDGIYFVCRQSQYLRTLLHCNTCCINTCCINFYLCFLAFFIAIVPLKKFRIVTIISSSCHIFTYPCVTIQSGTHTKDKKAHLTALLHIFWALKVSWISPNSHGSTSTALIHIS